MRANTIGLLVILAFALPAAAIGQSSELERYLGELDSQIADTEEASGSLVGTERVDAMRRAGQLHAQAAATIRAATCPRDWSIAACAGWAMGLLSDAEQHEVDAARTFATALFVGQREEAEAGALDATHDDLRSILSTIERRGLRGEDQLPLTQCMLEKRDQLSAALDRTGLPAGLGDAALDKQRASGALFGKYIEVAQDPSWSEAHVIALESIDVAIASEDPWFVEEQALAMDAFMAAWLRDAIGADASEWSPGLPPGMSSADGFVEPLACERARRER